MAFQKLPQVNAGSVAASLGALNQSLANIQKGNEVTPDLLEQFATKRRASDLEAAQEALRLGNEIPTDSLFGIDQSALTKYSQNLAAEDRAVAADAFTRSLDPFKLSQEQYKSETAKEKLDIMRLEEKRAQASHILKQSTDTTARDKAKIELNQLDEQLTAKLGNLRARTEGTRASTKSTAATTASTEESTKTKTAANKAAERLLTEETSTSEGLTDLGDRYDSAGNLNPNYVSDFNTLYRDLAINANNKNAATRLKPIANEIAAAAGNQSSAITSAKIEAAVDINDPKSYTSAIFNTLVNDEFIRLRKDNPHADASVLRKAAISAINRTPAGVKFAQQEWYEKATAPALFKQKELERSDKVKTQYREKLSSVTKALGKTGSLEDAQAKLLDIGNFLENNSDVLTQNQATQYQRLLNRSVEKNLAIDFNPVKDFKTFINGVGTDGLPVSEANQRTPIVEDHSPTNKRTFINQQVEALADKYPLASRVFLEKQVLTKMQKSPLAIKFQTGAIPARLAQLEETLLVDERENRMKYRSDLIGTQFQTKGGASQYTIDSVTKRLDQKYNLTDKEKLKVSTQINKVFEKWKGWFGKDKLDTTQTNTLNIALYEIMSGLEIDKDDTSNMFTLWLDESDVSLPSIDPFDDVDKVSKHQALSAILGHIHRSRVNVVGENNKSLIELVTEKTNKLEKATKNAQVKKLNRGGGGGLNSKGETLIENILNNQLK